jgi:hypothetical protein
LIIRDADLMISLHEEATGCEICGNSGSNPMNKLEVHHIYSRGMGGGSRLDIGYNLIVLCHDCHASCQANKVDKRTLWGIAAQREIHKLLRS